MDDGIYLEIFAAKEGKRINLKIVSLRQLSNVLTNGLMYEAINFEERRCADLFQLEIGLRHKYEDLIQKQDIGCCPVEKTPCTTD